MKSIENLMLGVTLVFLLVLTNGLAQSQTGLTQTKRVKIEGVWYTLFTDSQIGRLDLKRIDCEECKELINHKDSILLISENLIYSLKNKDQVRELKIRALKESDSISKQTIELQEAVTKDLKNSNKKLKRKSFLAILGGAVLSVLSLIAAVAN